MKVDPRFLTSQGPAVFTGNELLLKGALETAGGVHLLGGYPGSPIAGFFDAMAQMKDLLNAKGIRAILNNNEALAAAALNGSQLLGLRGMIVIKSVGVHVAADALALGNLAGGHTRGGAVVVYGDDPWSDSTQVAIDSRYISRHLHIPTFEPANPQEVKDFVGLCFKVSAASELYAGYVLTTNQADGGGSVQCRPNQYPQVSTVRQIDLETAALDLEKFVLLPPKTWTREAMLAERHQRAVEAARGLGLNRIEYPSDTRRPVGFAACGHGHAYLLQALLELGLLGEMPILKFGMSYPVDAELVRRFAEQVERIVVVEERRGFLEEQIVHVVATDRQHGRLAGEVEVWGKQMPGGLRGLPSIRGLHPSILIETLVPLLKHVSSESTSVSVPQIDALDREIRTIDTTGQTEVPALPARTPTFCPGCPHRDSAGLCLQIKKRFMDEGYMRRTHRRGPADLVFHGDTGCYTMLMYPPNTPLMHDYSGMGLGGGTGAGTDPFITNKQVVFMGDSTFFHSGQLAIGQAIKLGQDITFIILDNRTTAMTGHQPTPGVDYDILGNPTPAQDIEEVVRGMASGSDMLIARADPEQRKAYGRLLEKTFLADGVKVLIADKECGITRMRRKRRAERAVVKIRSFLPSWEHMNINQEICRFCLACMEVTGCPGLKHVATDYGLKMDTDLTWCVNDGACERLGACDAFEHVIIKRKHPPRSRLPELGLSEIPEPTRRPVDGTSWRCCVVGFGGMGIGVTTSILVRAGHKEGYKVRFVDKKGLAIRNAGVVSQVVYDLGDQPLDAIIPFGKADLLIGLDILEAARTLDPRGRMRVASKDRTAAVINTDKVATVNVLLGQDEFAPTELETLIRAYTRDDDFLARNISRICEKYLGSKLYANVMMLGFAFQKGLIPVSMHSMAWAIKDTIRTEFRKNLYAFNMGRKLVVQQDLFQGPPQRTGWRETLEDKCRHTIRRFRRGQRLADELRELAASAVGATKGLEEPLHRAFVVRLYDCMRWGGVAYARRYADNVLSVYRKDSDEFGYAATRAVIHNLANAMLIKDMVFKAELATSPDKLARDREKYNIFPANGDRILYRHLWHPKLRLAGREFTWDMTLYPWMLAVLKR
ncbi:MAG TPA: 2-oxoacid:acceptor oxidoreductase family protein, partial [Phycisphaerae bacterium]|nr:2-oxoacid:acceptor oxidoreductase family protein [Phycisphaerae bacterium]